MFWRLGESISEGLNKRGACNAHLVANNLCSGVVVPAKIGARRHRNGGFGASLFGRRNEAAIARKSRVGRLVLLRGALIQRGRIDTQGARTPATVGHIRRGRGLLHCGRVGAVSTIAGVISSQICSLILFGPLDASKKRVGAVIRVAVSACSCRPRAAVTGAESSAWWGRSTICAGRSPACRKFGMNEAAAFPVRAGARHPERLKDSQNHDTVAELNNLLCRSQSCTWDGETPSSTRLRRARTDTCRRTCRNLSPPSCDRARSCTSRASCYSRWAQHWWPREAGSATAVREQPVRSQWAEGES